MCHFFSAISNGVGKVLFFTIEQISAIEKSGNPNNYEWNSHSSIAHFHNIFGNDEDKLNKWEYDCDEKKLKIDGGFNARDDSEDVRKIIEKYLAENNALYCQKIYCRNAGYRNTGDRNAGDCNAGDRNAGDCNAGNRNAGNCNAGNRNAGDWNAGDCNAGNRNAGNWNAGNRNAGNWNAGNWNAGYLNTITSKIIIFNKETDINITDIKFPHYFNFPIIEWVTTCNMIEEEKNKYPRHKIIGGFLRKCVYKEAWTRSFNAATADDVRLTLKLPNFDYAVFEEISGITKDMIEKKLS